METDINVEVSWKYRKRSYRYQSEIMENLSQCVENTMESPSDVPSRTSSGTKSCVKCRCRVRPVNTVCLRRLLTVAVFLLPWTICNAAPWSLNQDTPAGNHTAVVNTRRRHHHHNHKNNHNHKHGHRQHHHKKNRDIEEEEKKAKRDHKKAEHDENIMKAATTNLPVFVSDLVAFSKDRPPMPPWAEDSAMDGIYDDMKLDSDKNTDQRSSSPTLRREKRSAQAQQAVCDSMHSWVRLTTATDIYGNEITVMDKILTNGGEQVSQWFYETKCSTSGQTSRSCRGIDTHTWESECLNRQSFVYAMVRTTHGEEGWNWIAINTACNCALRRKSNRGMNRRAPYPFVGLTETERR